MNSIIKYQPNNQSFLLPSDWIPWLENTSARIVAKWIIKLKSPQ